MASGKTSSGCPLLRIVLKFVHEEEEYVERLFLPWERHSPEWRVRRLQ